MANETTTTVPYVYLAINAVQSALSKEGVQKDRRNQQQGYQFRGIDDMYNAIAPHMAANGLCILPRMLNRVVVERATKSGGALFYVTVEAEFDFVATKDGSKHTVKMYGEAMDSADKATNKAMSAAYKYAVMQTFAIPTEGDNDADAHHHEVAAAKPATTAAPRQQQPQQQRQQPAAARTGNVATAKGEQPKQVTAPAKQPPAQPTPETVEFYGQFEECMLARGFGPATAIHNKLCELLAKRNIDHNNVPAEKQTQILGLAADGDLDASFNSLKQQPQQAAA
jgi:hypothetical protein